MNRWSNTGFGEPREQARLVTVKEYAQLRHVSIETVRRWLRAGRLDAERTIEPHGHWRIRITKPSAA